MMNNIGFYVHVPFCRNKCYYCDFPTTPYQDKRIEGYFKSLKHEIKMYSELGKDRIIDTIFIGGGTPTYVDAEYIVDVIETISKYFIVSKDCEITIEGNPGTISNQAINIYVSNGINRLSLGVQSSSDILLKFLGRDHITKDTINTVRMARSAGINNINMDFIFNIPGQKFSDILDDFKLIKNISPEHISWYSLIVEERTKFHRDLINNRISLLDEKEDRKIYHYTIDELRKLGMIQYEISNFARAGYESRHNLKYWTNKEYFGVGLGACGYIDKTRYRNTSKIIEYVNIIDVQHNKPVIETEILDNSTIAYENLIMGLRLVDGIDLDYFKSKYGVDLYRENKKLIEQFISLNKMEIINNRLRFTKEGFDISDYFYREIKL